MATNRPEWIVLHHTVTSPKGTAEKSAIGIDPVHKGRGFPKSSLGWHVGYHYLVGTNGDVFQTRKDSDIGSHCRESEMNFKSLGISLIGNFEIDTLEEKQHKGLVKLLKQKVEEYNIPRNKVSYHGKFKATQCPGKNVITRFERILNDVYGDPNGLVEWELNALDWAAKKGMIVKPEEAPFELKQVAWLCEVLRKSKQFNI